MLLNLKIKPKKVTKYYKKYILICYLYFNKQNKREQIEWTMPKFFFFSFDANILFIKKSMFMNDISMFLNLDASFPSLYVSDLEYNPLNDLILSDLFILVINDFL